MTKALDTWTPTGCQGELLRADEVNLYYQNARLGRVDYMTVHEGIIALQSEPVTDIKCKGLSNEFFEHKKFYYIGLRKPATLVVGGFTDNNFHKTDWRTTWWQEFFGCEPLQGMVSLCFWVSLGYCGLAWKL